MKLRYFFVLVMLLGWLAHDGAAQVPQPGPVAGAGGGGGGGGGSAAGPQFSVQFNNPLGTFAGDGNFTYTPAGSNQIPSGMPAVNAFILANDSSQTNTVALVAKSGNQTGPWLGFWTYRGTSDTPTAVHNGDTLAIFDAFAFDGASWFDAPEFMQIFADGDPVPNSSVPTAVVLQSEQTSPFWLPSLALRANMEVQLANFNPVGGSPTILSGFTTTSNGVWEFNDGSTVATGGHYADMRMLRVTSTSAAAPTVTSGCTAGGGSGVVGTDMAGIVTTGGTAATSCTITFNAAYANAPTCGFFDANASSTPVAYSAGATSTTTAIVDFASASSKKIAYVCIGH